MKRITLLLLALTIFSVGFAAADTITIRSDTWPPYNDEPGSAKPGYMIEVVEQIFAAKGHTIDYQLMPWNRCLEEVQKGTYDAAVGTDTSEAADFVFPSESFGLNQNGFFVKKGSDWKYAGIDSLKSLRLGIIDGYGYTTKLDQYIEENGKSKKLFAATGDDALTKLIKMLKAGRLDVVVENINVMAQTLNDNQLENEIVNVGLTEESTMLYIGFSPAQKSSREYSRIFDAGLAELRSSGKLQQILSGYGLKDWK